MTTRHGCRFIATLCGLSLQVVASAAFAAVNLIANSTFDTNLSGWSNLFSRPGSWSSVDAGSNPASGSALLVNDSSPSNGGVPLVLTQCIAALPSTGYIYGGQFMVPAGQPADTRAHVFVETFASADCSGAALQLTDRGSQGVAAFEWLGNSVKTTPDVHSILVGIGVFKPIGVTATASAYFDNVFLVQGDTGFTLGPGMSGSWFNPAESGHGIMLDLLNPTSAWMCWFTFDLDGNRAWICATGTIDGNTISFNDAIMVAGGKFPPLFNPAAISGVPWGSIYVTFAGCGIGSMVWQTSAPHFQSGSSPLARVTQLWGLSCP